MVRVQLDCGVATSTWWLLFPNVTVRHVVVANSDHMGLLLKVVTTPIRVQRKKWRLFRFEHVWVREGSCEEVILEAWSHIQVGTPMFRLVQKIKQCRIKLLQWNQTQAHATPRIITKKKAHLQMLEEQRLEVYDAREVNQVQRELCVLMEKEETFWHQCSWIAWLKGGDSNTRFFRECASQRKRMNTMAGLKDSIDV